MKFIQSYQNLLENLRAYRSILVIFTDPDLLTPSESLVKYFSYNNIAVKLGDHVFICKVSDIKIFEKFNVLQFPQVTVLTESALDNFKVLYNFIGCNQEKSWEALCQLATATGHNKPYRKLNINKKLCPSSHDMKFTNEIDEGVYKGGCFKCDDCRMLSHVEVDRPILHCEIC